MMVTWKQLKLGEWLFVLFVLSLPLKSTQAQLCPVIETPNDALGPFYPGIYPKSNLIGPAILLEEASNRLQVTGRVLSSSDCSLGLANVQIELWYAGEPDDAGQFYRDDEYRGKITTNECGEYNFTQTFPEIYPGRPLHIHFRLSRNNQELLVTQMYFVGVDPGYVSAASRVMQAVSVVSEETSGSRSVEFDIYVDMQGDADCSSVSSPTDTEQQLSPPTVEEEQPSSSPVDSEQTTVEKDGEGDLLVSDLPDNDTTSAEDETPTEKVSPGNAKQALTGETSRADDWYTGSTIIIAVALVAAVF